MKIFNTLQGDLAKHNGKKVTIVRELVPEVDYDAFDENDKMYEIKLETGEEIHAFSDEIVDTEKVALKPFYEVSVSFKEKMTYSVEAESKEEAVETVKDMFTFDLFSQPELPFFSFETKQEE